MRKSYVVVELQLEQELDHERAGCAAERSIRDGLRDIEHNLDIEQEIEQMSDVVPYFECDGLDIEQGMAEVESWYTSEAVCPYCGHIDRDSWELGNGAEGCGVSECGECGKEYSYQRHISVSYSTEKMQEDQGPNLNIEQHGCDHVEDQA